MASEVTPISKIYIKFRDCEECGAQFGYEHQSRRFCTKKCADAKRHRSNYIKKKEIVGTVKPCQREGCGNDVYHYPNQLKRAASKYCSMKCFGQTQMTNKPLNCVVCAKEFYCSKSQQTLRNRKTCSMECRGMFQQSKKVGSVKLRRGLMQKAQMLCNRMARIRDRDENGGSNCISCGVWHPFERLDGGHFIPTTSKAVRYDLRNINAQCWKCNRYLSGNSRHYLRGMIAKYGQEVVND